MRLSLILLVAAAFVASLDFTAAASDSSIVNAVKSTNVHESVGNTRSLRTRKEGDDLFADEDEEERVFSILGEAATAFKALKKLATKSGDDLVSAISGLPENEVNALFNKGKAHLEKIVPGFQPGMSMDEFATAVNAARLPDDAMNALLVGYGKYLAYGM